MYFLWILWSWKPTTFSTTFPKREGWWLDKNYPDCLDSKMVSWRADGTVPSFQEEFTDMWIHLCQPIRRIQYTGNHTYRLSRILFTSLGLTCLNSAWITSHEYASLFSKEPTQLESNSESKWFYSLNANSPYNLINVPSIPSDPKGTELPKSKGHNKNREMSLFCCPYWNRIDRL